MKQPFSCTSAEGKTRIISSCSGMGSNVGQLSNAAACHLSGERYVTGSGLARVAGKIERLVGMGKTADETDRHRWLPVACAKTIMEHLNLPIDRSGIVTDPGIARTQGPASDDNDMHFIVDAVKEKPVPHGLTP
jgi:uncharacterized metal-binding protein